VEQPEGIQLDNHAAQPVILFVSRHPDTLGVVGDELTRRYSSVYQVIAVARPDDGLDRLRLVRDAGAEVALIMAGYGDEDSDGLTFLAQARRLHPAARRAAVVIWGQFDRSRAVFESMATGAIDSYLIRPEHRRDEEFHEAVTQSLDEWGLERGVGFEAVRIISEERSARAHELDDMLTRNHIPTGSYDAQSAFGRKMLDGMGLSNPDLPVVVVMFGAEPVALENPTHAEIIDAFGLTTPLQSSRFDVTIIGAGPAGLSAAVYAASEGLDTLVVERQAVGGQAGTSSLIRNYPGFRHGVSGNKLAFNAFHQAWSFGATFRFMRSATRLRRTDDELVIDLSDGTRVRTETAILATGVEYRRLEIPELEDLVGRGVFYMAAVSAAPSMQGKDVYVVGGGNSAGQAAVHLARYADGVTMLVRGPSLAKTMSEYLITEIDRIPNIAIRPFTEVVGGSGGDELENLVLRDRTSGDEEKVAAHALFVLIGSEVHTAWLEEAVACDDWGFVLVGRDLPPEAFPLERAPFSFETTVPGVFAVGDLIHGSVKRVASAVGAGAIAIAQVHNYLEELSGQRRDVQPEFRG
jgi:thioredoxin reductase